MKKTTLTHRTENMLQHYLEKLWQKNYDIANVTAVFVKWF